MIEWMQKHRKWLVITIWVSTIAFVGAGFVGWGAYKFGSSSNAVAKVGDIEISIKEFNQRYKNLYNYFNNMLKGNLDEEKAKKMGLQKEALNSLITEALYLNLAKELGLTVLDKEVEDKILSMKEFQRNGVFDKNLYFQILQNANIKPKDFEESLKKEILISKIKNALRPVLTKLEFNTFGASLFMADKLKYKVLDAKDINASIDEKGLKEFWQKHKNSYQTKPKYRLSIVWVEPKDFKITQKELEEFYQKNKIKFKDENGKIKKFEDAIDEVKEAFILKKTKKEALKKYILFKKGKIEAGEIKTLPLKNSYLPNNIMETISKKSEKSYLKPKLVNKKYVIIRLDKRIPSRPMSFIEAKELVKRDFIKFKKIQNLKEMAKKMYKDFDGNVTNYISRDDIDKLPPLTETEAGEFLNNLFVSNSKNGYIILETNKAVLYNIIDQKLIRKDKLDKNRDFIDENSLKVKNSLLNSKLLDDLQKRYEIKIYKGL